MTWHISLGLLRVQKHRLLSFLRFLQAVTLVITASLVAAASGYCARLTKGTITTTVCDSGPTTFSINHWSDGTSYTELQGQYFVFVCLLALLLTSFGLFFLSYANYETDSRVILVIFGTGALTMFVCGIVESWYASGFGKIQGDILFYIRSWVAGAIGCFVAMLLYIADVLVAVKGGNCCQCQSVSPA